MDDMDVEMESSHGATSVAFADGGAASAASPSRLGNSRAVLRIRLSPAWTPEEDACLARLAAENGFRHWRRVAGDMARSGRRRSPGQCRERWREHLARDVYHRPFTADDDAELARLLLNRDGGDGDGERSWKDISREAYCRTSRGMRRRWRELQDSDAFLRKLWCPPLPPIQPSC
uniref:Myb-like domain-containing protein n=1 Tax=Oryza punctata TaxID=4537 RepID=A0A0E0KE48_ORYPU